MTTLFSRQEIAIWTPPPTQTTSPTATAAALLTFSPERNSLWRKLIACIKIKYSLPIKLQLLSCRSSNQIKTSCRWITSSLFAGSAWYKNIKRLILRAKANHNNQLFYCTQALVYKIVELISSFFVNSLKVYPENLACQAFLRLDRSRLGFAVFIARQIFCWSTRARAEAPRTQSPGKLKDEISLAKIYCLSWERFHKL